MRTTVDVANCLQFHRVTRLRHRLLPSFHLSPPPRFFSSLGSPVSKSFTVPPRFSRFSTRLHFHYFSRFHAAAFSSNFSRFDRPKGGSQLSRNLERFRLVYPPEFSGRVPSFQRINVRVSRYRLRNFWLDETKAETYFGQKLCKYVFFPFFSSEEERRKRKKNER